MGTALAAIALSTVGGVSLAFVPAIGPAGWAFVRTFGVVASVGVVALHLLPEAYEHLGLWAFVYALVGVSAPALAERGVERARRSVRRSAAAFWVGLVGLAAHSVVDGLTLFELERGQARPALVAFAAHLAPVSAVVAVQALALFGRGGAIAASLGLALAAALGVALGSAAAGGAASGAGDAARPFVTAVASGLLLHVVLHGAGERERAAVREAPRAVTLAVVCAVALVALPLVLSSS
jgi:hypothetical protein